MTESSLESALSSIRRQFEVNREDIAQRARTEVIADFRELLRRFRTYQNEEEWVALLTDGAGRFSREFAIFGVRENRLAMLSQRGLDLAEPLSVDLASAPAMTAAIESKDVIFALLTAAEFSPALGTENSAKRAFVVPVLNGERVVALLFAVQAEETDTDALELLAGIASVVLERQANASVAVQIAPAPEKPQQEIAASGRTLPTWSDLSQEERLLQARAQRFARVKVAELQLNHPDAARAGIEQNNVYLFLKKGIDAARESYRMQFMADHKMVDYLHLELVRAAAQGDELKLGEDYPGPMV